MHTFVIVLIFIIKVLILTVWIAAVAVLVFKILDAGLQRRANEQIGEYDNRRR